MGKEPPVMSLLACCYVFPRVTMIVGKVFSSWPSSTNGWGSPDFLWWFHAKRWAPFSLLLLLQFLLPPPPPSQFFVLPLSLMSHWLFFDAPVVPFMLFLDASFDAVCQPTYQYFSHCTRQHTHQYFSQCSTRQNLFLMLCDTFVDTHQCFCQCTCCDRVHPRAGLGYYQIPAFAISSITMD